MGDCCLDRKKDKWGASVERKEILLQKMKEAEVVGSLSGTQPISFKHIPSDAAALYTHCYCVYIQRRADDSSDNVLIRVMKGLVIKCTSTVLNLVSQTNCNLLQQEL